MQHKLQNFPPKSDVQNSVVRNDNSTSQAEIASNDAGLACADSPESRPDQVSTASSLAKDSSELEAPMSASTSALPTQTTGRAESPADADVAAVGVRRRPEPRSQEQTPTQPGTVVPQVLLQVPRCEVARSAGYDPRGENAVACGATAQVLCEYCGPMCSSCAEETFCFYGEHKLSSLEETAPLRARSRRTRRVSEVVYVEIKCPNCRSVRLALPKKHRPKARRKCPVCKREAPAEYLAHGFTRRRLPYHEVFTTEKELPEGADFKRRMPWDRRPPWWVED